MTKLVIITATAFNREGEYYTASRTYFPGANENVQALTKGVEDEARDEFESLYFGLTGVHITRTKINITDVPVVTTEMPAASFKIEATED